DTESDPEEGWFDPAYYNNRVWGDAAAQDAWAEMWRYTAQRYKDNPIVVGYDLMCEPNSNEVGSYPLGDPLDEWDPEAFYETYGGTLYDWNQLFPRITAAIREVDEQTPILVGGMGYSAIEWLPYVEPTDDPRTVYAVHQYAPHVYTHQHPPNVDYTYPGFFDANYDGRPEWVNRAWLENLLETVAAFRAERDAVVAVNEYGLVRWAPNADRFMKDEMDLFEAQGLNYALWAWESSWPPIQEVIDAFNFRHGPDPNHHSDVETSALIEVIKQAWARNSARPIER
ncbi:MAG: glycoside hydrolase family 5 protein, partial [Chloroflexi bacterium]|nr:glycoside hydrolase family 5 protein [Chloroflexota bacterium]